MNSSDSRWEELRSIFATEIEERLPQLNALVLQLERSGRGEAARDTIDALFREVHSLKGAARAVGLSDFEQMAHALESVLAGLRHDPRIPDAQWFDAAYRAIDCFKPLYEAALRGQAPPPECVDALDTLTRGLSDDGDERAHPNGHEPVPAGQPVQVETTTVSVAPDTVRVAVSKLDVLLAHAGELVVAHSRIAQRLGELQDIQQELAKQERARRSQRQLGERLQRVLEDPGIDDTVRAQLSPLLGFYHQAGDGEVAALRRVEEMTARLQRDEGQLGFVARAIEAGVMAVRLLPVATLFGPIERMVRDMARDAGKEIHLLLEGRETEIDRKILEQLRDPLMHMVRNAVDHGIETPEERVSLGKSRVGTVHLVAAQRGGEITIQLEDDGAGIVPARIRDAAVRKGLVSAEAAAGMDDRAAVDLIFKPGFSSRTTVTETSGRGVGMDVVRQHVERLNGRVEVQSISGKRTCFTITVPLTLATTRAVLVEQNGQLFAIPSSMIEHTGRVQEAKLVRLEGRRAVILGGAPVPVVELSDILEQPPAERAATDEQATWRPFFVLRHSESRLAILTDRLLGEQEIVVKSLGWPLRRVRNVGGAAVLGTGETVVILNPSDMLASGHQLVSVQAQQRPEPRAGSVKTERRRRRVLVADDSVTTRTLEKTILEAAGYETVVVPDGAAALDALRTQPVDIVVSDIEMPRLDGFALTAEIRRDEALQQLPVILVTSLEARSHRERGAAVGADAYIVKSGFDQGHLLDAIGRLL